MQLHFIFRCRFWVQNTRRLDLLNKTAEVLYKNNYLCAEHFEENQFMNSEKKKLVWNAVPTIFNIPNPPKLLTGKRKPPKPRSDLPKKPKLAQKTTEQIHAQFKECSFKVEAEESPVNSGDLDIPINSETVTLPINLEAPELSANIGITSDCTENSVMNTPRKVKLRKQLHSKITQLSKLRKKYAMLRSQVRDKQDIKDIMRQIRQVCPGLSQVQLCFFESQMNMSSRCKKGRRWTCADKKLALSLFYQSPRAYKMFQKIFLLPSVRSLRQWISQMTFEPGFQEFVFDALKAKAKCLSDRDKMCILMWDEMSIKSELSYDLSNDVVDGFVDLGNNTRLLSVANQAMVFQIQGIFKKWKQPIGYVLSTNYTKSDDLLVLVKDCLDKLTDADLNIVTLVCDLSNQNRSVYNSLGITVEKPFFNYKDRLIFCMYDPPHLLKCTRNNLKNYDFELDGNAIKWNYIEQFIKKDNSLAIRLAPKVTMKHIMLPMFSKMKVKLAAQTLSHTVAAGIETYVSLGCLPPDAAYTADFIEKIDSLFDVSNGSNFKETKLLRRRLTATSAHVNVLKGSADMFKKLIVKCSPKARINFVKGWRLTISALLGLWENLSKTGVKYLFTRSLNQDAVENLYSSIRQHGGNRSNPNASQFKYCLKQHIMKRFFADVEGQNCENDLGQTLFSFLDIYGKSKSENVTSTTVTTSTIQYNNSLLLPASQDEDFPEKCVLSYITGHVLRKAYKIHLCNFCLTGSQNPVLSSSHQIFTHFKSYTYEKGDFGSLISPRDEVLEFMSQCETTFVQEFNANMHKKGIMYHILRTIEQNNFSMKINVCKDFQDLLVKLYIRMRLYYATKFINQAISTTTRVTSISTSSNYSKLCKVLHLPC